MKILQNQTVFVISTLSSKRGVKTSLYFYERDAWFKRGWEDMGSNYENDTSTSFSKFGSSPTFTNFNESLVS